MPRRAAGLSAAKVKTARPGRYGDGAGLYLLVRSPEAKFWLFRYTRGGRMREMGLGPATGPTAVGLADARLKARDLYETVRSGRDPLADRAEKALAEDVANKAAAIRAKTFRDVAVLYLAAHEAGWRNAKHRWQWEQTLTAHAFPHMGDLPIADVDTPHVMAALEPIWRLKPETASRLRGRIEAVIDYGKARGWRTGENPARWRGHVANMLPAPSKIQRVEHHAALPWREIGAFMIDLRTEAGLGGRALEFTILTAARTNETIGARWAEFDLAAAVWTVPGERMKAGREHRVPLSTAALSILTPMAKLRTNDAGSCFVFPGVRENQPLSNMAMMMTLRRMGRGDLTVHGFRSCFRDWVGEATNVAREVAEAALAHVLVSRVEAAYARSDLFEKRRVMMEHWAAYCTRAANNGDREANDP